MKDKFKYVVISVILLIPFIYSFFYLKAYWNPYGEGNIDNLPVAVVNLDKGNRGTKLINSIKESKKLKLSIKEQKEAENGLYNGKYYAIINIPEDFTEDIESASSTNKKHPTITYSPNQKANFLASQIINSVVNAVEKNLDNQINSAIVEGLSEKIEEVPEKLNKVSDGFKQLKEGTEKLNDGSKTLKNGTNTLNSKYNEFHSGLFTLNSGVLKLQEGANKLSQGIKETENGSSQIKSAIDSKITELKNDSQEALTEQQLEGIGNLAKIGIAAEEDNIKAFALQNIKENAVYQQITSGINAIENGYINNGITTKEACNLLGDPASIATCTEYLTRYPFLLEEKTIMETVAKESAYSSALTTSENVAKNIARTVANESKETAKNTTITSLTELSKNIGILNSGLNNIYNGSQELSSGIHTLYDGSNTLYNGSLQINYGINNLNSGARTLSNGINTMDSSVGSSKKEIDKNIENTKENVKTVDNLSKYSKNPVKIDTKVVNEVNSYGTAFSPFFMCIGLWVGSLMMFMVLYYDKEERFGIFGNNSNKKVKQILAYHGLITLASLILGMLLHMFLDLKITNIVLYYLSLVLTGNTFMGIIELLIIYIKDVGKFIALILLVLQLAAAGGTFPIETVTKGFRWLKPYLPMSYTVDLLRECLIKIDGNLLVKNFIIISVLCIALFAVNILLAKTKQDKIKK